MCAVHLPDDFINMHYGNLQILFTEDGTPQECTVESVLVYVNR